MRRESSGRRLRRQVLKHPMAPLNFARPRWTTGTLSSSGSEIGRVGALRHPQHAHLACQKVRNETRFRLLVGVQIADRTQPDKKRSATRTNDDLRYAKSFIHAGRAKAQCRCAHRWMPLLTSSVNQAYRRRDRYFGPMVATGHQACLCKPTQLRVWSRRECDE